MTKYHINSQGVPAICRAQAGNCPFGGNEQHFENIQEAQEFADKLNEDRYGIFKNVKNNKVYEIPEGTPQKSRIDKDEFVNNNHKLIKSEDNWVHLDDNNNVIGTMKDPIAIYDNDGDLVEIADIDNYSNKMSVQGLRALKSLSRFNLVSKDIIDSTSSINFYSPKEDIEEYKDAIETETIEAETRSLNAIRKRIELKGPHETSDLFRGKNDDGKITNHFRQLEESHQENKDVDIEPVDYNPAVDNWEDIPSAENFGLDTWKNKNLDLQMVNGKWAVIGPSGEIYGRLENPAVAVNFEDERIEAIGEYDKVNSYCKAAKDNPDLNEGNPSSLDQLGSVRFDVKNNNLNKIRNLLKFSWAFREPTE